MKISIILLVIIFLVLIIWIIGTVIAIRNLEEPRYTLSEKKQGYELREYESYIVAEVQVVGNQEQALNSGFRLLAGYIFGGNTKNDSIAMTVPVIDIQKQSESIKMTIPVIDISNQEGIHTVQFTMPSKYTLETLPKPNNSQVTFREIPPTVRAVLRYTGFANEGKVADKKQVLRNLLQRDGVQINGDMISAQYNPPLSFPYLRRNEILVDVQK